MLPWIFRKRCTTRKAKVATRQKHLREADAALNKLRLYLRLAYQWHWLSAGQYQHVSNLVAELGRLLGGWVQAK